MLVFVYKKKPLVGLTTALAAGRSLSQGRRVLRTQKNSLCKRVGRVVNFLPHLVRDVAQLLRIERDPLRSSLLGLFRFLRSGFLSYMLLPLNMRVGDFYVINFEKEELTTTSTAAYSSFSTELDSRFLTNLIKPLALFSKGSVVHCIEKNPFCGFKLSRSAGSVSLLEATSLKLGLSKVLLPSGKRIFLPIFNYAASGGLANDQHRTTHLRKAGQAVWRGRRPLSRGVAMNPVDHPHGGGEGKTSGGRPSVSFSGVLAKGYSTSKFRKKYRFGLVKRRFELFG